MFTQFKQAVQRQFNSMKSNDLFRAQTDRDLIWETYIKSFPEGSNPLFRERTEHDCTCCRSFIRNAGNMVAIVDGELASIWDINVGGDYQIVADALSAYVKSCPVENIFLHSERAIGVDKNYQQTEQGTLTFEHFHIQLPNGLICRKSDIGTQLGEMRSTKDVMLRALQEITLESVDTVLELIGQNSLYRGDEHKFALTSFRSLKIAFDKSGNKDLFCWANLKKSTASVTKIRGTVIGTLLVDLSEGKDLEQAVAGFESKVAPTNYKRPTALVTGAMIESARAKVEELGLISALDRRFAVLEDISINNVLFANREAKKRMDNVFDEVVASKPTKKLEKVEEIGIEQFITNVLPNIESMEVMLENRLTSNLVSLIAPVDLTAKCMFKWNNPFSWSYSGELADSIKERVKKAGGSITGDVCCRLAWDNKDDLDFHMVEPDRHVITYTCKRRVSRCGGVLDLDANGSDGMRSDPAENIVYPALDKMKHGTYELKVHQYHKRETKNPGFTVEIDVKGEIHSFTYPKAVKQGERVTVAQLIRDKNGIKIIPVLPTAQATKEVWGIPTQTFHKVSVALLSPNYWDQRTVGNKHYFFMLEGCINGGRARGFFNEFLTPELDTHRKVLEMVGAKLKVDDSPNQMSGIGFSSTQRNSLLCRVKGAFTRTIKINF